MARELPPVWPWAQSHLGPPASPWEGWFLLGGPDDESSSLAFNIWESYTDRFLRDASANWALAEERWEALHTSAAAARPFNTHCIGHGPLQNWCVEPQPAPWLEPLPSCTVTTLSGNTTCESLILAGDVVVDAACGADIVHVRGGGVVGNATQFSDFANRKERWWGAHEYILAAMCCFILVGAIVRGVQFYKETTKRPASSSSADTTLKDDSGNNSDGQSFETPNDVSSLDMS